jgi:hypothetical protein
VAQRFRFPGQAALVHNTVFGLSAVSIPIVNAKDLLAGCESAKIWTMTFNNSGKFVSQYNGKRPRIAGPGFERRSPLNFGWDYCGCVDSDQGLSDTGTWPLHFSRNQGFGSSLFCQVNCFHLDDSLLVGWLADDTQIS